MDFTISIYKRLLDGLIANGYVFQTFNEFLTKPQAKSVILRHDVDKLPTNSLRFARIQHELGLKGTYYFRMVPESWDVEVILSMAEMGHELGYHYETMDTSSIRLKKEKHFFNHESLVDSAFDEFRLNLEKMRKIVSVNTICMHGSPKSPYDNKEIWKKFSYTDLGIIGEPYFDVDFNEVLYLTDTGRRWDGYRVSVRDKVETSFKHSYHTTDEIIQALKKSELPDKIMFTFHPQRWHDNKYLWTEELVIQNIKNIVKKLYYVK